MSCVAMNGISNDHSKSNYLRSDISQAKYVVIYPIPFPSYLSQGLMGMPANDVQKVVLTHLQSPHKICVLMLLLFCLHRWGCFSWCVSQVFPENPLGLVVGMAEDKDHYGVCAALRASRPVVVIFTSAEVAGSTARYTLACLQQGVGQSRSPAYSPSLVTTGFCEKQPRGYGRGFKGRHTAGKASSDISMPVN
jgi:hypothetical protein